MEPYLSKIDRLQQLKEEIYLLENELALESATNPTSCRMEEIRGIAVPICGHDLLTEYMIEDLRQKNTTAIYFYGGLLAKEDASDFHWYVSTIRLHDKTALAKYRGDLAKMSDYLQLIYSPPVLELLSDLYVSNISTDDLITYSIDNKILSDLEDYNLITITSTSVKLMEKGIQAVVIASHLVNNHLVKPPAEKFFVIMQELSSIFGDASLDDHSRELDELITLAEEEGLFHRLEQKDITRNEVITMIKLYYEGPF